MTQTLSKNPSRLSLDCILCMAFLSYDSKEWKKAKEYFDTAYFVSPYFHIMILEIKTNRRKLLIRDVPH